MCHPQLQLGLSFAIKALFIKVSAAYLAVATEVRMTYGYGYAESA